MINLIGLIKMPYKSPDQAKEYHRRYREARREKARRYAQEYREKFRDSINEKHRHFYLEHRERYLEKGRQWRARNPDLVRIYAREKARQYREERPAFRLMQAIRSRIRNAIKSKGGFKGQKTLEMIGCSADHLKAWLTFFFQPGMSWENYGEWHIDHVRPCAHFDLTNPDQQKECFNYTNLQPLWGKDNLKKGARDGNALI